MGKGGRIEGVYIPSSYVSAGLVAAYQCPEFLRTHFKNVSKNYPGVRFDIEASDYALRVPTSLSKEISGYTNSIKEAINSRSFGFILSSDNNQVDGKDMRQITVYKARSMNIVDNEFESLYKTLTSTYITRILRAITSDNKQDNVEFFFSNDPRSQKKKWLADTGFINSILLSHDDIDYRMEAEYGLCNVDIVYGGNTKNLEIVLHRTAPAV